MAGHRRSRLKTAPVTWILLAIIMIVFVVVVHQFPLLPKLYKRIIAAVIALLGLLLGWLSFRKKGSSRKLVVSVVNTVLSILLIIASVFIPTVSQDVKSIIVNETTTEEITVNIYALTSEYKFENSDVFRERGVVTSANLADYSNKQFITQTATDQENQSYVLDKLATLYGVGAVWKNETANIWEAMNALYTAQGDAIIINSAYVTTIEEIYPNFEEESILLYSYTRKEEVDTTSTTEDTGSIMDPFVVFIAGSDSRDAALTTVTRTDVDILMVVNPQQNKILLVSLPRDTYIANPALSNGLDKLTHMGIYGIANSCAALSQLFETNIDKYALVNFNTYTSIINTIGGVDIENPYEFSSGTYTYAQGNIHLDGDSALAYVRERYSLSNGDFGRNEHQIIVLKAILQKLMSVDSITNFQAILESLSGTFLTNVPTDDIFELISEELTQFSSYRIISRALSGSTGSAECASMPGQLLSVVYANETSLSEIKNEIAELLESGE